MLEFKKIEMTDRELLEGYFKKFGFPVSDNCFGGLYIWQTAFESEFAIFENTVILRGSDGGRHFYQCPIGENAAAAVRRLVEEEGEKLCFCGLCPDEKKFFEQNFGDEFSFVNNRDNSEYVYEREPLCTFAGKKYQQKRNHVNKFTRLYGEPEAVVLCADNLSLISGTEHLWLSEHDSTDIRIIHENSALKKALDSFEKLGLLGVAVRVGEKTVGFGIGERLSDDTVIEHFEKADRDMDGCYAVVIREFAKILPQSIKYINREEDMGLEGLRKSKLSLKPAFMEEKYDGIYVGQGTDNIPLD